MKSSPLRLIAYVAAYAALPLITFAQVTAGSGSTGTIEGVFQFILTIINDYVVPLIFAIGFVVFLFGVYTYFIAGGANEEKVAQGRNFILYSLVGFAVMVSVWGLINLFVNTLGLNNSAMPCIPTFGSGCAGQTTGNGSTNANGVFGSTNANGTTNTGGANGSSAAGGYSSGGYTTGAAPAGYEQGLGTVQTGGACYSDSDCAGNLACSPQHQCVVDGSLDSPGYGDGDGTVQQGGACEDQEDCAGNLTCTNSICVVDSSLDVGNGTQGAACQNSNQCSTNLECINSECEPDNGLGQQGEQCTQDSDCQGNLACVSGSCQYDSSLDSGDTYDSSGN